MLPHVEDPKAWNRYPPARGLSRAGGCGGNWLDTFLVVLEVAPNGSSREGSVVQVGVVVAGIRADVLDQLLRHALCAPHRASRAVGTMLDPARIAE